MTRETNDGRAQPESYLRVFADRSVLVDGGEENTFMEGRPTSRAQERMATIREALEGGFLIRLIEECKDPEAQPEELPGGQEQLLSNLVDSVTSERGRAIVGLTLAQLCIKCIVAQQNIRLHKGGTGDFSWREGVSIRTLDRSYFTPTLRESGLLSLNADGFMMTRSLAENYPYTNLYKAAVRGARQEWLTIVDLVERDMMNAEAALRRLIGLLMNRSQRFRETVVACLEAVERVLANRPSPEEVQEFVSGLVERSSYSARVFEIALHGMFQVLEDRGALDGPLKPLSQMRSANKKHGDIGDVEVTIGAGTLSILESWDAKYGKPYLREELEELNEKLEEHPETRIAGFVVDQAPSMKDEIVARREEIEATYDVSIRILGFADWVSEQFERAGGDPTDVAYEWLRAVAESLCQMRRERAPIDEPSDVWVEELLAAAREGRISG